MELKVKAPAKINFGLNVVGKREDGYHNIETIFYPVTLSDTLEFFESGKYILETDNNILNSEKDNLISRARNLLQEYTGKSINVRVHLKKHIPVGAGLGGGSSDAAATLVALNRMFKLNLDSIALNKLALSLGSDVPFFLNPYPSFGSSRGELLEQIDFRINGSILIINPGIFVSTKWAYEKITPQRPAKSLIEQYRQGRLRLENFNEIISNDFEIPVMNEFQAIARLKEELYEAGADFALMSGSGSTVFALFSDENKSRTAKEQFGERFFAYLQSE